jgi:putative integral membrane protein (TIGR02587 family)
MADTKSLTMQSQQDASQEGGRSANLKFLVDVARAFGGAIIFALPMFMTMEMWWLGFYMDRFRLVLLALLNVPLLTALSYHAGFKETFNLKDDLIDAFVAYAVGIVAAVIVLLLFSVIEFGMPLDEIIGKVLLQAIPGSIGAMLAVNQLGSQASEKEKEKDETYFGELLLMVAGALFLAFNVAPTEEMVLIAYQMTSWHALALALVSLLLMHAFVFALEFRGQAALPQGTPQWSAFLRFTVVGYALALLVSLYVLWTFGRTDGTGLAEVVSTTVVLGFPAAIGAAAARLIL